MTRRTAKVWKTCKCGRSYSKTEWGALELCGEQRSESERLLYRLEMRHCACGSTIGIEYRARKPSATNVSPTDQQNVEALRAALADPVPRALIGAERHETGGAISVYVETHKFGNTSRYQIRSFYTAPGETEPCGTWRYGGDFNTWEVGQRWVAEAQAKQLLEMAAGATRDWHKGFR
jgi:hypothetical protein